MAWRRGARARSRTASWSSRRRAGTTPARPNEPLSPPAREELRRWVAGLLATPGLTALDDFDAAWRQHVEDSLAALPLLAADGGPLVDVGSGGGAPGLPLAAALPGREVTLLEASERKCEWLRAASRPFPNVHVARGRAEEQPVDAWSVAVAKALAPPPVAAEWCLPLVRPGGAAILYVADDADAGAVGTVAAQLGGGPVEVVAATPGRALLVLPKLAETPPGYPRRVGVARKRPLA